MKIEVENIGSIIPKFNGGGNLNSLIIDASFSEGQAESLFYQILEYYEGGIFEQWLKMEGYELRKLPEKQTTTPQSTGEPQICPKCKGVGHTIIVKAEHCVECVDCDGTGKLRT